MMQSNPKTRNYILHTKLTEVRIAPFALGVLIPQSGYVSVFRWKRRMRYLTVGGGANELGLKTSPPYTHARARD